MRRNRKKRVGEEPEEEVSVAVTFFNNHPEAPIDVRSPKEKLEEIGSMLLQGAVEDERLFTLLIQQVTLSELEYGRESIDAVVAATQLGALYNSVRKFDSALRYLQPAFDISQLLTDMTENDKFHLAVEYADVVLSTGLNEEGEMNSERLNQAEIALMPFSKKETSREDLRYRRDVCCARMKTFRRKFEKAVKFYSKAIECLKNRDLRMAKLMIEGVTAAVETSDKSTARSWFNIASEIMGEAGLGDRIPQVNGMD